MELWNHICIHVLLNDMYMYMFKYHCIEISIYTCLVMTQLAQKRCQSKPMF